MFNSLNSIETENKIQAIFKYSRIGIIILIPLFIIFLIVRGCNSGSNYRKLENEMIDNTKKIISPDEIDEGKEVYIDLYTLEEEASIGALQDDNGYYCDKASGVSVKKVNGKLVYTPYLLCGDYRSSTFPNNKTNNYLSLKGASTVIVNTDDTYVEPGYTASNGVTVEVVGSVYNVPGLYNLQYNAVVNGKVVESVKRSVIVTESEVLLSQNDQNNLYDDKNTDSTISKKPVISLKGEETINLRIGDNYQDPGYSAFDKKDGDITNQVEVLGSADTAKIGTYVITYRVRNSLGYQTSKERTVIIAKKETALSISHSGVPSNTTTNGFTVSLNVQGAGYKYTILPNMTRSYARTITYNVNNNGTYKFYIYDENGNVSVESVNVNTIDNTPPTAACSAKYENSKTLVEVNNISNDIAGYSYSIDGNFTTFETSSTHEFSSKGTIAYVKVKDAVGNIRSFSCDVIDKSTTTPPTPVGGTCDLSNIMVTIKTCFKGDVIDVVNFDDYLKGAVYGEISIGGEGNDEQIKAYIIFARNFSINRGLNDDGTITLRSCSSDQNYCDIYQGCYRYQTQAMFDSCMNFSMSRKGYYKPQKCADRVTTYPGSNNSINLQTVYHVDPSLTSNQYWDSTWPMEVVSGGNTHSWHRALNAETKAKIDRLYNEVSGLVVYDANGKLAGLNHHGDCSYTSHGYDMCQKGAYELSQQGKTYTEIVDAFSQNYPNHKIACYQGKTIATQ